MPSEAEIDRYIRAAAEALPGVEEMEAFVGVFNRFAEARVVLLDEALVSSKAPGVTAFAADQGISQFYATRLVRLA